MILKVQCRMSSVDDLKSIRKGPSETRSRSYCSHLLNALTFFTPLQLKYHHINKQRKNGASTSMARPWEYGQSQWSQFPPKNIN